MKLTLAISTINAWNRIALGFRNERVHLWRHEGFAPAPSAALLDPLAPALSLE